jgi:hypothetical protein
MERLILDIAFFSNSSLIQHDPYEFPPFISIREDIMPQRRNISMLIYSESDAFLGSLQESYLSETVRSGNYIFMDDINACLS